MRTLLASELDGLANALDRLAQRDRHTRDFTLRGLRDALTGIVAAFPVYRSYVGPDGARGADAEHIRRAVAEARGRSEDPESGLYHWIERVLLGELAREAGTEVIRRAARRFVTRFEQVTAPVMAKGLEDTSFYRFPLLLSLTEVGGDPRRFGVDPARFHAANRARVERHPRTLLSTSTHDTKRGEDVRARIDVLSERPAAWRRHVEAWARLNRKRRRGAAGAPAPAPKDEYLLYQTLLGSFPAAPPEQEALADYCTRIQAYMQKALREGKERSSWRHPDVEYEQAVEAFVADLLSPGSEFLDAFVPFAHEIASLAALNGLSQLVLKLTSPGVPDTYQGCEGWDLSLADPDNRRPVDFEARSRSLEALAACVDDHGRVAPGTLEALRESWRDGRIKHWITWRLLTLRRMRAGLFADGSYLPAVISGERAANVVAFARTAGRDAMLVAVPRLAAGLPRRHSDFPLGRDAWGDTRIVLPDGVDASRWRDRLCDRPIEAESTGDVPEMAAGSLFETLPLAVLVNEREGA
jgi:(1->4)-alpha-D-glucan 1-alpha-D-glucosylmutase